MALLLKSAARLLTPLGRKLVMPAVLPVSRVAATASVLPCPQAVALGGVRFDSTKRKRAKKMNKHKYQKLKKRMRNLTAKNVVGTK